MANYIDGFVLPIPQDSVDQYKQVAQQVAHIWKEYGALEYYEYVGDDLHLQGTRSFGEAADVDQEEAIIFGWVVFPSKEVRDQANKQVPVDLRMKDIVGPLIDPARLIFDPQRMIYGGFKQLV